MLEGIDISTYQSVTPSLAGLSFVFARASYGTSPDLRYAQHAADVRAAGLVLGAYHYWQLADPASQVATFLAAARDADLLAIDLEGADSATDTAHAQVTDMIARLAAAGRSCGLYHSLSSYPELGQSFRWVAAWGATPPAIPWTFWQYQGSPLDHDRFAGTLPELEALVAAGGGPNSMAIYAATLEAGTVTVAAGTTATGLQPGDSWTKAKTAPGPFTAHTDELLHRIGGTTPPTYAAHMTDGPLAGLYVGTGGGIAYVAAPKPPSYTQAQLDAARAAGFSDAKGKALAAVQGI